MKKQFLSDSGLTELIGYIKRYIISNITWGNVTGKPSTYPPEGHTHDDRYYTESEVDSKLSGKANVGHTHSTATTDAAGFMSSTDKTKLNTLASEMDTYFTQDEINTIFA